MVKGPSRFGVNLGFEISRLRLRASNQTLSPLENGVKKHQVHDAMTWWVSSWAARASFRAA
jgi:hypothetical protein